MDQKHSTTQAAPPAEFPRYVILTLRVVLVALIAGGGLWIRKRLIATAPTHQRKPPAERSVTVTTQVLAPVSRDVVVHATGTVVPARELSLRPRISGEITAVHPDLEPGALLRAGTVAVSLDATDYELTRKQTELSLQAARIELARARLRKKQGDAELIRASADLTNAQYAYKLELGKQDVARREWELVADKSEATDLDRELTLRKPHLQKAVADVDAAKASVAIAEDAVRVAEEDVKTAETTVQDLEAALELAVLNVERCQVRVPFDAVVVERQASVGGQVSSQTDLASLVDSGAFWVRVSLPADRLPWVRVRTGTQAGSGVTVRPSGALSGEAEWSGEVIRRLPSLEANGRQARVLVAVSDPLAEGRVPLLLDSFVSVEIEGPRLDGVFELPRETVHNGHDVWLYGADGRLVVKEVSSIWSDRTSMLVDDGLEAGDTLVTSDLASPVPGMKLARDGEGHAQPPVPGASRPSRKTSTTQTADRRTDRRG